MRATRLFFSMVLGALLLANAACSSGPGGSSELDIVVAFDTPQATVGPATLTMTLTADGAPVENAEVEVEGNMSHAGMVPVHGTAREISAGLYEVELEFTMGGDWFLIVDATLPDGSSMQGLHEIPGVLSRPLR